MAEHPTNPDVALVSGDFWGRNPHPELHWIRQNAPVYWDGAGEVWGLSKHADVLHASRHPEVFSSADGIRPDALKLPMMIDMDEPEHYGRRKLVNRGFTPRRVREQTDRIGALCDDILDRVCEQGSCDFVRDIAAPLPLTVIGDALGVAPEDRQQLLTWSDTMLRALTGLSDTALLARAAEAAAGYTDYINAVADERRGCPRDDLISVLVHAEVDGDRLDAQELVYESLLILIGGDETTRHVLSGGTFQLCTHPDQRAALAADPARIPVAIEEMLRWVSPIKNMNRTLTRDVELRGQRLEEGDRVLLLYPSANRDEDVFAEPDRFDAGRTPNDHVAFGVGSHFCLGSSLARLELTLMFERLLARMPDLELVDPVEPAHLPVNFVSGYESMPVRFSPSAPLRRP